MEIGVIGTGYVGLVTGACLAAQGHRVVCVDIDTEKVTGLRHGQVPIHEPRLEAMVRDGLGAHRLVFTSHLPEAVRSASVLFIAVGTPPREDGSADTRAVVQVADAIARAMHSSKTVVIKSTVPVGTAQTVRATIANRTRVPFTVLSNPEFLREGHAVQDFLSPSRVIVGADREEDATPLRDLYLAFVPHERILVLDTRSAELSKYASNAFLATKISFINEIAALSEAVGANVEMVRRAVGLDPRIGPGHLSPGLGYGGSCLPKDLGALLSTGKESGAPLDLLAAVHRINSVQPARFFQKIHAYFQGSLAGKRIAVWGLAFKGGTDDVRHSPSLELIDLLRGAGAYVVAYDPAATARAIQAINGLIEYADDMYECARGADALVIATDWSDFLAPDWARLREAINTRVIFDGRNVYDPSLVAEEGFVYSGIGQGQEPRIAHDVSSRDREPAIGR